MAYHGLPCPPSDDYNISITRKPIVTCPSHSGSWIRAGTLPPTFRAAISASTVRQMADSLTGSKRLQLGQPPHVVGAAFWSYQRKYATFTAGPEEDIAGWLNCRGGVRGSCGSGRVHQHTTYRPVSMGWEGDSWIRVVTTHAKL